MSIEIHPDSHLDHDLTAEHIQWLLATFADRDGFFVATVLIPEPLEEVDCGLYGPACGNWPVAEADVTYAVRGARKHASRLVAKAGAEDQDVDGGRWAA